MSNIGENSIKLLQSFYKEFLETHSSIFDINQTTELIEATNLSQDEIETSIQSLIDNKYLFIEYSNNNEPFLYHLLISDNNKLDI